jgi:hypothetical protein
MGLHAQIGPLESDVSECIITSSLQAPSADLRRLDRHGSVRAVGPTPCATAFEETHAVDNLRSRVLHVQVDRDRLVDDCGTIAVWSGYEVRSRVTQWRDRELGIHTNALLYACKSPDNHMEHAVAAPARSSVR